MLCGYKRAARKNEQRENRVCAGETRRGKREAEETREGFRAQIYSLCMIVSHGPASFAAWQPVSSRLLHQDGRDQPATISFNIAICKLHSRKIVQAVVFHEGHSFFVRVQSSAKDVDDVITDICGRCNDMLRVARSLPYTR